MERRKTRKKIAVGGGAILLAGILGVTGYFVLNKQNNFERIVQEDGTIKTEGTMPYDRIKKYEVVEVQTVLPNTHKLYLGYGRNYIDGTVEYYDIFTNERICSTDINTKYVKSVPIEDFFIANGALDENVTGEEVDKLITEIEESYSYQEGINYRGISYIKK